MDGHQEAIADPPQIEADLAMRYLGALASKAALRAQAQSAWRSPRDLCRRGVAIVAASVVAARGELVTAPVHERAVWMSRLRKLEELEVYASMVG